MRWLFSHGWGFDHRCWNGWLELIPKHHMASHIERGYYGDKIFSPSHVDAYNVIVTHSLGLHHIAPPLLQCCNTLVILSGFQYFHYEGRISRIQVRSMLSSLKNHPHKVLKEFYQKTFYPDHPPEYPQTLTDQLNHDLHLLNKSKLCLDHFEMVPNLIVIHGTEDQIVPLQKSREWYDRFPQSISVQLAEAGHALPLTHAKQCYRVICDVIKNFEQF